MVVNSALIIKKTVGPTLRQVALPIHFEVVARFRIVLLLESRIQKDVYIEQ